MAIRIVQRSLKYQKQLVRLILIGLLSGWLGACPVMGQAAPHPDCVLDLTGMSKDGRFAAYRKYCSDSDSIVVIDTKGRVRSSFSGPVYGEFLDDCFLVKADDRLIFQPLTTGKPRTFSDVASFTHLPNDSRLLLKRSGIASDLIVTDYTGSVLRQVEDVDAFQLNTAGEAVAFSKKGIGNRLYVWYIAARTLDSIPYPSQGRIVSLAWATHAPVLSWITEEANEAGVQKKQVFWLDLRDKTLSKWEPSDIPVFRTGTLSAAQYPLSISADGAHVYFGWLPEIATHEENPPVMVWTTDDKQFSLPRQSSHVQFVEQLACWNVLQGKTQALTSATLPNAFLTGDGKGVLAFDPLAYEPQYDYAGLSDYFIIDPKTGEHTLLLKKHTYYPGHLQPSPSGRYIAYFTQGQWWVFDFATQSRTCLTQGLKERFDDELNDTPELAQAYGVAGWAEEDRRLFLYDRYDMWEFDLYTAERRRLTDGRPQGISLRLPRRESFSHPFMNYRASQPRTLHLKEEQLLQAKGMKGETGYYRWSYKTGAKRIVFGDFLVDRMFCSTRNCTYLKQDFQQPPSIYASNIKGQKLLVSGGLPTNSHPPERIAYTVGDQTLQGYLCYPDDYRPGRQYPMIVRIYQRQMADMHQYVSPRQLTTDGFNAARLTRKGYFVFFPDITYTIGFAGTSATDCVTAAVAAAVKIPGVDSQKVGLIGHSFGGYETLMILTQTDLFAVGVSGAGVGHLESFYLNVNWESGKPDMWRMESQQWRVGKSLFEDPQAYRRNSPLWHAQNINSPLLLWAGDADHQVDWHQSVAFHVALRRLGKNSTLLLYKGEGHNILSPDNQLDLCTRIEDWFDRYLKLP